MATIKKGGGAGSPSESLIAAATKTITVLDTAGKTITLRKPDALAQYRIVKALGDTAANQTYLQMVLPLLFIATIDGDPVPFPQKELEIEALIMRLDDPGLAAVMKAIQENWGAEVQDALQADIKN